MPFVIPRARTAQFLSAQDCTENAPASGLGGQTADEEQAYDSALADESPALPDTCFYCKYHEDGQCLNTGVFESNSINLDEILEDGTLRGAIEEGMGKVEDAELVEDIIDSVIDALHNFSFTQIGTVYIKNPKEFSCKGFW